MIPENKSSAPQADPSDMPPSQGSVQVPPELGRILHELSRPTGVADMPDRIQLCHRALELASGDYLRTLRAQLQLDLGNALAQNPLGDRAKNIERAIEAYQTALQVHERDAMPAEWARTVMNLGTAYLNRVEGDRLENIQRAIRKYRRALEVLTREQFPLEWAGLMMDLGNACAELALIDPDGNAKLAVRAYGQALRVARRDTAPTRWAELMTNIGTAIRRKTQGDRAQNTEAAIKVYNLALQELAPEKLAVKWAEAMMNRANAYGERINGDPVQNTERAIEDYQLALKVHTRQNYPGEWSKIMMNIGNAYMKRIAGDRADNIEKAIDAYQQALEVRAIEDLPLEWAEVKMDLANALLARVQGDSAQNVGCAIVTLESVLDVIRKDALPLRWAFVMLNLGNAYAASTGGEPEKDLERAIECYEAALEVFTRLGAGDHEAGASMNLAKAYRRLTSGDQQANAARAIRLYEDALRVFRPTSLPIPCYRASTDLGDLHAERASWTEAIDAYGIALEAAETLYRAALIRPSREVALALSGGLHRRAAYALACAGCFEQAVVSAERGRCRALREALALDRTDLERARLQDPQAHRLFQEASARLRHPSFNWPLSTPARAHWSGKPGSPIPHYDAAAAARGFEEALTNIRRIEGYEGFLAEPDLEDVRAAVTSEDSAPLIYLVPTRFGSVALFVTYAGTDCVRLDGFSTDDLCRLLFGATEEQLAHEFPDGRVEATQSEGWLGSYARRGDNQKEWLDTVEQTTQKLWDAVMEPVVRQVSTLKVRQAVLIPGGLLALLPLHAAWTRKDGRRQYAMDEVAFSYAPSARALIHARRMAETDAPERLLAVAEPRPVSNVGSLRHAHAEVDAISALFDNHRVLRYEQATRDAVLAEISQADVIHFSCHGMVNWGNPLDSGLLLAGDEMFRVRDLLTLTHEGLRLATLSACETGIVGPALPDEAVGLPAAFLQAGFAGVAASLWSVHGVSTAVLMERFYRLWREQGLEPALALREAQSWLRDTTNAQKAGYFRRYLGSAPDMPPGQNSVLDFYSYMMSLRPEARCFAHPIWWAAFYLTGV